MAQRGLYIVETEVRPHRRGAGEAHIDLKADRAPIVRHPQLHIARPHRAQGGSNTRRLRPHRRVIADFSFVRRAFLQLAAHGDHPAHPPVAVGVAARCVLRVVGAEVFLHEVRRCAVA